ncbi:MAG: KamA family radical SAM protein [Syntrophales bacterium]|nr:KamA family radical SAM protein [Syntrophales bacterium]
MGGDNTIAARVEKVSTDIWRDWKWQCKNRIHTLAQLARVLNKPLSALRELSAVAECYHFSITPYYLSLIDVMDENDPLRLQCFPDLREIYFSLGGVADPLGEEMDMPVPNLVHRYPDRCLAMVTNSCFTYCRHCNRKRMWGGKASTNIRKSLRRMINYISQSPRIREVIVSGGDPLTLRDETLNWFLGCLRSIPHVEVLRIGSRAPVILPMRITQELCTMLRRHRPLWFITQFNHPREITLETARACEMLLEAGIPVSNQSVLLRGVNDSYETMRDLLHGLQRISVKPYYLFQCDLVKGTDHFRVDLRLGVEIMEKTWKNMSGLCVPRYVLDLPGGRGKIPLPPFFLRV